MELRLKSDLETRLKEHAAQSGYTPDELVSGLVEGYLGEIAEISAMLDFRPKVDDRGEANLADGEEASKLLRRRAAQA